MKKLYNDKKGLGKNIMMMLTVGIGVFIVGLVLTFFGLVNSSARDTLEQTPTGHNNNSEDVEALINNSIAGGTDLADFLSPVALVGVAVVILSLIVVGLPVALKK